jgi:hypothetical protein
MYKKTFLLTKPVISELLVNNTKNLMDNIKCLCETETVVDVYILLHRYATDVIAEFTYGPHGSTKTLVDPEYRHVAEQFALSDRRAYQLCQIHFPFLANLWSQFLGILATNKKIGVMEYGWQAVQQVKSQKINDPEESLATLMISRNEFSDAYIASELLDHMVCLPLYLSDGRLLEVIRPQIPSHISSTNSPVLTTSPSNNVYAKRLLR